MDGHFSVAHSTLAQSIGGEAEARSSTELYRSLFEAARVGVAYISPEDGVIVFCNDAYASVLGSTPEEIAGRSFFEFLDAEQEGKARRERELRLGGVASEYEVTATAADGGERRLLATGAPLYGEGGSYLGAVQTLQDVTARRRAEEELEASRETFRLAFEHAPVGVALVSAEDGRFLEANERFREASGYGREELSGLTWQAITPPEELGGCLERVGRALEGGLRSYSAERRYVRKDGSRAWIELSVSLARRPSGDPDHFVCVAADITERKLKELLRAPLTPREEEVLGLIVQWRTNREIARSLTYSVSTIKSLVQSILDKLEVEGRREAAARAVEIGLIRPPR